MTQSPSGLAFDGELSLAFVHPTDGTPLPGSVAATADGRGLIVDLPKPGLRAVSPTANLTTARRLERLGRALRATGSSMRVRSENAEVLHLGTGVKPNWWLRLLGFRTMRVSLAALRG